MILLNTQYYSTINKDLGKEFLEKIDDTFQRIEDNPKQFPKIYRKLRRALLNKFPYSILFVVEKLDAVVLAVFYQNQNPKTWKNRVKAPKI